MHVYISYAIDGIIHKRYLEYTGPYYPSHGSCFEKPPQILSPQVRQFSGG